MGAPVALAESALVALLIAIIIISVVGNCLVCVAIFTDRRLRKLGNAFIVSLAIADLFVSCLVMTFALCNDLMEYWIFGDWFCDVWISFDIMCCTASILNLCAISLDRFIHIKDCLLYNQWMTRRVAFSAVLIIWFISALVSFVPINLGWHKPDYFGGGAATEVGAAPRSHLAQLERQVRHITGTEAPQALHGRRDAGLRAPAEAAKSNYRAGPRDAWPIENQSAPGQEPARVAGGAGRPSRAGANIGPPDFVTRAQTAPDWRRRRRDSTGLEWSWQRRRRPRRQQFNQVAPTGAESNSQDGSAIKELAAAAADDDEEEVASAGANFVGSNSSAGRQLALVPTITTTSAPTDQHLSTQPQCMLTLTPTYAIISSTISFYIPCIIMLGLYTKLFACARKHVRNIQAISKAPAPIAGPSEACCGGIAGAAGRPANRNPAKGCRCRLLRPRTWIKFGPKRRQEVASNAQSHDKQAANLAARQPSGAAEVKAAASNSQEDSQLNGSLQSDTKVVQLLSGPARARPESARCEGAGGGRHQELERLQMGRPESERPLLSGAESGAAQSQVSRQANRTSSTGSSSVAAANQQKSLQRQQQQQQQQQFQQSGQLATHKAAVTLGIIMGTFLFCWVPFFCLNITKAFCIDCIPSSLFRAFTWLGYANSALNPIIYGIHNSEFRNAFNRIFFKHLNIKSSRHYLNRRFSYDLRHTSSGCRGAFASQQTRDSRASKQAAPGVYRICDTPANNSDNNNDNNNSHSARDS